MFTELKDKGLDIIAINRGDTADKIEQYVKENGFSFKIVQGGSGTNYIGGAYGVRAYPTNYLVGPDGKVLWRGVGFNEAAIRKALEDAGFR